MYKRIIAMAIALIPLSAAAQQKFTVTGTLKGIDAEDARVVLMYSTLEKQFIDTVRVKNGQYKYTGEIFEPTKVQFNIYFPENNFKPDFDNKMNDDVFLVYVDKGNINLASTGTFRNFKATGPGAIAQMDEDKLKKDLQPYEKAFEEFQSSPMPEKGDVEGKKRQDEQLNKVFNMRKELMRQYLRKNPNSRIAADVLQDYAGNPMKNADSVQAIMNSLSSTVKAFPGMKRFKKMVDAEFRVGLGRPAIEFSQADTAGVNVSLASYRGKYVLIDFWASWCGPCRRENPFVVEAFNKFKDKNFTVLSVSLDGGSTRTSKQQWLDAIHADGLTGWTHVSDMQGWNNAVSKEYGINSVPQNFLINPDGIIIARNVRGEQLEKTLEKELNK